LIQGDNQGVVSSFGCMHQQTLRQLDRLGSAVQRPIGPQSPQRGAGLDRTGQLSAKSPQQSTDLDSSS
jgi:hypothetical protein